MNTRTSTSLTLSRVVNADPATVFRAWTEPDQLQQWSAPEGASVASAEVDLTVGGRYKILMKNEQGERHTAVGVYRVIEPPRRLVYTWSWEEEQYDVGQTQVTVEFNDLGGSTEIVLTHERFPDADATGSHEKGWTSCLNRLEGMLSC
jgi:uncharacterized protein YndB with AHSA1/START domain